MLRPGSLVHGSSNNLLQSAHIFADVCALIADCRCLCGPRWLSPESHPAQARLLAPYEAIQSLDDAKCIRYRLFGGLRQDAVTSLTCASSRQADTTSGGDTLAHVARPSPPPTAQTAAASGSSVQRVSSSCGASFAAAISSTSRPVGVGVGTTRRAKRQLWPSHFTSQQQYMQHRHGCV